MYIATEEEETHRLKVLSGVAFLTNKACGDDIKPDKPVAADHTSMHNTQMP